MVSIREKSYQTQILERWCSFSVMNQFGFCLIFQLIIILLFAHEIGQFSGEQLLYNHKRKIA